MQEAGCSGIIVNKEKKKYWTDQEVIHMLYLIEEKNILSLLDGKRYRNSDIFAELAETMVEGGYVRTPEQLRSKWKSLKRDFHEAKRKNSTSGCDRSEFQFYDEMSSLLDCRPSARIVNTGVYSTPREDEAKEIEDNDEVEAEPLEAEAAFTVCSEESSNFTVTATTRPTKNRRTNSAKGGYASALATFAQEVRTNQLEVQREQQKWFSEEFERDRQWEKQLLENMQSRHAEETQQLVNSFLSGLQCIYGRNDQPQFSSYPHFMPQPGFFSSRSPSPAPSPSHSVSFPSPPSVPSPPSFPSPSTSNFHQKKQ